MTKNNPVRITLERLMMVTDCRHHVSADYPYERERDQFHGHLPTLKSRENVTDEFGKKMLHNSPVPFYRLSDDNIAAAR